MPKERLSCWVGVVQILQRRTLLRYWVQQDWKFWSDVPGMFTANPKQVPSARLLKNIGL